MNKNITTPSLQEKTINLKKYSDKIKLLYSLAKNDASLRSQILAKARDNSVKSNSSYAAFPAMQAGGTAVQIGGLNTSSPSAQATSFIDLSATCFAREEQGHAAAAAALSDSNSNKVILKNKDKEQDPLSAKAGGRRIALASINTKTPLVRISRRLHRHIKSVLPAEKFNSVTQSVANNNTIVYNFNSNFKKFKLTSILENSFFSMNRLISKPVISIKPNKVIIHLFFYLNRAISAQASEVIKLNNLLKSKSIQLQALCAFLSKNLKKPVEFELIRLHHPSLESNILANTIGHIAKNTRKTFRVIMLKLFKSIKIKNLMNLSLSITLENLNLQH